MVDFFDKWRLFEAASEDIKNLGFGDITKPKFIKRLSEEPNIIKVNIDEIPEGEFPANDSDEVKKELRQITDEISQASTEWSKSQLATADIKPIKMFLSYLEENGLEHDEGFLDEIYKDVARIVLKLKVKYDRPRLEQLGALLGFDFSAIPSTSDNSPSFPSGHAAQAWTVAHFLTRKHPSHKGAFYDIARRIEKSRIARGAHYPSDIVYAKYVAKHYLAPSIEE